MESSSSSFDTFDTSNSNFNKSSDWSRNLALEEYEFSDSESPMKRKLNNPENTSTPAKLIKKSNYNTSSNNRPPLYDAILFKNLKLVQYYLETDKPNVETTVFRSQTTPLHLAAQVADKTIIKELLNYGFKVNVMDLEKKTPLHLAVDVGSRDVVKFLLNNGANVNLINKNGFTPLHSAVKNCNSKLLKANSSWMHGDFITETQALSLNNQNFNSKLEIVEELLECRSTDINMPCSYGKTALYYACTGTDTSYATRLVKLILRYKVNVNVANIYGRTALSISMTYGRVEIVEALLKKDVNCSISLNAAGLTPILWGVSRGITDLVNLLLKYCTFDVNSRDLSPHHGSLLHYAAEHSNVCSIRELVNAGADVCSLNKDKVTPFLVCASQFSLKFIENRKFFLEHLVKLESENKYSLKQEELAFIYNNHNFELELHYTRLKNELLGLKASKIPTTTCTFYDFLVASDHDASLFIQNESVQKYCSHQVLKKLFPAFSRLMRDRYAAGRVRSDLLKEKNCIISVQKVFYPFINDYGIDYAVHCANSVEKVLRLLNNRDLKHLMKACANFASMY